MDLTCKYCGCTTYELKDKGIHTGAYCTACGKWIKWLSKDSAKHNAGGVSNASANSMGSGGSNVNNIPEPVLGTEKAKLILSEGALLVHIGDKYYTLYKPQDMMEHFRVVMKQGNTKTELLPGEQLNIYIV